MNAVSAALGRVLRHLTLGLPAGPHITRYTMYRRLSGLAWKGLSAGGYVMAVSGSERLAKLLGYPAYRVLRVDYPYIDIRDLSELACDFAAVVCDQVLEHVEGDPADAVAETVRVTRPGGLIVHTTCCVNPIHGRPDLWRFTPDGLRLLVPENADLLEVGGWGNPLLWLVVALGLRFVPVPHARWHPLHWLATWNHPDWPVVTWLVMRRR